MEETLHGCETQGSHAFAAGAVTEQGDTGQTDAGRSSVKADPGRPWDFPAKTPRPSLATRRSQNQRGAVTHSSFAQRVHHWLGVRCPAVRCHHFARANSWPRPCSPPIHPRHGKCSNRAVQTRAGGVGLWHGDKHPHTKASGMAPTVPPHTTTTSLIRPVAHPKRHTTDELKSGPPHP